MSGEAELASGQALIAEGRFAEAAPHLEAAAEVFASVGSLREESHAAWLASVALRQTGDVDAARRFLQRSAEVLHREADQRVRVRVWMRCANDLAELDGTAAGLGWWRMAAKAAGLLDDPQLISEAEQAYAEALIVTGASDKALPHVERASEAAIRANETERATQVLHRSAELLSRQGRPREGLDLARQAWRVTRGVRDPAFKVSVAVAIGDFLRVHEQFEEAQAILNEAQNIADETGDGSLRATAKLVQGQLLVELGRINEGMRLLRPAARYGRSNPEWPYSGNSLLVYAQALLHLGDHRQALEWHAAAALAAAERGSPDQRAHAFVCYGDLLSESGRREEAQPWLDAAWELLPQVRSAAMRFNVLHSYAQHLRLGDDPSLAVPVMEHVLAEAGTLGQLHPLYEAHLSYGDLLALLGSREEAIDNMARAVSIAEQLPNPHFRCNAYMKYSDVFRTLGEFAAALAWAERAVRASEQVTSARTRCQVLQRYGELLAYGGDIEGAREPLRTAAEMAEAVQSPSVRTYAFLRYASLMMRTGDFGEAEGWLGRALEETSRLADAHTVCYVYLLLGELSLQQPGSASADEWLVKAAALTEGVDDPQLKCEIEAARMESAYRRQEWPSAYSHARAARDKLLEATAGNPLTHGISQLLSNYSRIFHVGLACAERLPPDADTPEHRLASLEFADAAKCVAIREGLQRHNLSTTGRGPGREAWHPGPTPWRSVFSAWSSPASSDETPSQLRGERWEGETSPPSSEPTRWLPRRAALPQDSQQLYLPLQLFGRALPAERSVLLHFYFDEEDLLVWALGPAPGRETGVETLFFNRTRGVRNAFVGLVQKQAERIASLRAQVPFVAPLSAQSLREAIGDEEWLSLRSVYEQAYRQLRVGDILSALSDCGKIPREMHAAVVPDGPLYELPLHAFVSEDGTRLYEQFASFRYGLSLGTLGLQQGVQAARAERERLERLRGVVFANDGEGLSGARAEVEALVSGAGEDCWWLHGDAAGERYHATRDNFLSRHGSGNLLWVIAHGRAEGDVVRNVRVREMSLVLRGGPVGMSRLLNDDYDFSPVRLLFVSTCWLGAIDPNLGYSHEVEAFNAVLTLRGCRRVLSALWPLPDATAPVFGGCLARALMAGPYADVSAHHAFAAAYREALDEFRRVDGRAYDHEFFWAPYTLYGIG